MEPSWNLSLKVPKLGFVEALIGSAIPFHCFRRPKEGHCTLQKAKVFLPKIITTYVIEPRALEFNWFCV